MRHAKSSWKDSFLRDKERPLNKRGIKSAKVIGEYLVDNSLQPDIIYSSSSVRTVTTFNLVFKDFNYNNEVVFLDKMYDDFYSSVIDVLKNLNDDVNFPAFIGHYPDILELTEYLTKSRFPHVKFSTASFALIHFDTDKWKNIFSSTALLKEYIKPKSLM